MDWLTLSIFLLVVLLGSYVQAVAGFAMGMIIVAVMGGLRLLDVPTMAAVVSLLSATNVILALRGQTHWVHRRVFMWLGIGQVPAIFVGLTLMSWLDGNTRWLLEILLGAFITLGGLSMFLRPHPWRRVASNGVTWLVGTLGGVVGGMFSASGPVLGWFGYSQPLALNVIRATLLACFLLTTLSRTVMVGVQGGLTSSVWLLSGLALPAVLCGTWAGKNFPPVVSDLAIKRFAYCLLLGMGVWILVSAWWMRQVS